MKAHFENARPKAYYDNQEDGVENEKKQMDLRFQNLS